MQTLGWGVIFKNGTVLRRVVPTFALMASVVSSYCLAVESQFLNMRTKNFIWIFSSKVLPCNIGKLKVTILLSQSPKFWDYSHVPIYLSETRSCLAILFVFACVCGAHTCVYI